MRSIVLTVLIDSIVNVPVPNNDNNDGEDGEDGEDGGDYTPSLNPLFKHPIIVPSVFIVLSVLIVLIFFRATA